jgi:hypothetical protein
VLPKASWHVEVVACRASQHSLEANRYSQSLYRYDNTIVSVIGLTTMDKTYAAIV